MDARSKINTTPVFIRLKAQYRLPFKLLIFPGCIETRSGRWEPALLSYCRFDVVKIQLGVSISTRPIL